MGAWRVVGAPTPTEENKRCIVDERAAGEGAHSSSTAKRSPFSSRRRQRCDDERSAGEGALRVVGGADPYDGSERKRREKVFAEAKRGEKVKYSTLSNVK